MGASDGIVSVSSILFGIAAANASWYSLLAVAFSATIAGALSMAVGEYVSVSAQDDASTERLNPYAAALASAAAFIAGAALPSAAILTAPNTIRLPVTAAAVLLALTLCGYISGHLTNTTKTSRSVLRVVIGGGLALAVTYLAGLIAA